MKRVVCFFVAIFMVAVLSIQSRGLYVLEDILPSDAQFCFYTYSAGQQFEGERVALGSGEILICPLGKAREQAKQLFDISGESVRFLGDTEQAEAVLKRLDATIIKTESVADIIIFYAKSPYLHGSLPVDGKRVNVQIAVREGFVTVGTPLILGSY